jgi:protein SCO1/2
MGVMIPCIGLALLALSGSLGALSPAHARVETASVQTPDALRAMFADVGFDQRLGAQVPLDLDFREETGRTVRLQEYFGDKPVILVPVYYSCTTVCPMVMGSLTRSLKAVPFDAGKEFRILTLSIDPRENADLALRKQQEYLPRYGRTGAERGWHFLTGEEPAIRQLTSAIGFRYVYDEQTDQFAHATGIVLLTPQGKVARYFYGIDFSPRDLRLGLVEAAAQRIGSPIDQLLLYCYHYDPLTGKYGLIMMNILRLAGLGTVLALGTFILLMLRRDRRAPMQAREAR